MNYQPESNCELKKSEQLTLNFAVCNVGFVLDKRLALGCIDNVYVRVIPLSGSPIDESVMYLGISLIGVAFFNQICLPLMYENSAYRCILFNKTRNVNA